MLFGFEKLAPAALLLALLTACGDPAPADGLAFPIPPGKADDYRSTSALEYLFRAEVEIVVPSADQLDDATVELVAQAWANGAIGGVAFQIDSRLRELWDKEDRKREGVAVTLREGSTAGSLEKLARGHYRCHVEGELAGPMDLLAQLPFEKRDGDYVMSIELLDQTVDVFFSPTERSPDSYPRYDLLFAGGLDIALFIGGDYNEARYDRMWATQAFAELIARGFSRPATRVTEMSLDSPPFRRAIDLGGRQVELRVRLIHAEMGRFGPMQGTPPAVGAPESTGVPVGMDGWPTQALDIETLRYSVAAFEKLVQSADVVIVQGHGDKDPSLGGVVLHYDPEVTIKGSTFRQLDLPESYQLFFFSGCETYAMYADQLYAHPKKSGANLDVVSAINYTAVVQGIPRVMALIDGFLAQDEEGRFLPESWDGLLAPLNVGYKTGSLDWLELFGVHGLDDNPTISPFADPSSVGQRCSESSQCPGGENLCIDRSHLGKHNLCGVACVGSRDCPAGTTCQYVAIDIATDPKVSQQCAPQNIWMAD